MEWALALVTPPAQEPVMLDEAKAHLRVDDDTEDAYIASLIVAAREWCENYQRRAYITQTRELRLDGFPRRPFIRLPRPPLQQVTAIKYVTADGTETTLDASQYVVDTASQPGRVLLAPGASWPAVDLQPGGAVRITYTCGYGDTPDKVPAAIRRAILLLVGHLYENREAVVVGSASKELPFAVTALLSPGRVPDFNPTGEAP